MKHNRSLCAVMVLFVLNEFSLSQPLQQRFGQIKQTQKQPDNWKQQQQQQRKNSKGNAMPLTVRSKHFGKDGLFEHPGTTSLFQTPQTALDTLAWLRKLPPKNASSVRASKESSTIAPLYFRHMRKAGGSTVRRFFERNLKLQNKYNSFIAMEWGVFPVPCFEISSSTIFVTALRNPVERAFSEFRYGGAGRHLRSDNTTMLRQWMSPTKESLQELARGLKRGIYLDNYYVRALTGRCLPRKHLDRIEDSLPCKWGGAYGGGCRPEDIDRPVDENLFELATAVLSRFDMCLILEWFDKPALTDWLHKKLGSPSAPLKRLGWERTSLVFGGNTYDMSQRSEKILTRDNTYDMQLYEACKKQTLDSMKELEVKLNFEAPKDPTRHGPFRVVERITAVDIGSMVKKHNKRVRSNAFISDVSDTAESK